MRKRKPHESILLLPLNAGSTIRVLGCLWSALMKWYYSVGLIAALGLGVYFHFTTFDPITSAMLVVVLLNNHNLMKRQEETALLIKRSHDVLAANQKSLADSLKTLHSVVRKLQ
jgi:Co/Zn/Cd efflux system component